MFIYMIHNQINNKRYIGLTTKNDISERYLRGIAHTHNEHLKRSIEKYGVENFVVSKLSGANSLAELNELEVYYIKKYNTTDSKIGYNKSNGGNAIGQHTPETIEKMRMAKLGIVLSEETKKKISENTSGEKNGMYGKGHLEHFRKAMSEVNKGRKQDKTHVEARAKATMKKVSITDKEGNVVIYNSVKEAAEKTGNRHIHLHASGKRNKVWKGFTIEYA